MVTPSPMERQFMRCHYRLLAGSSKRPLSIFDDVLPCVLDQEGGVQAIAVEMEPADVLAAGIGVVVVAESEVDRAKQSFFGR